MNLISPAMNLGAPASLPARLVRTYPPARMPALPPQQVNAPDFSGAHSSSLARLRPSFARNWSSALLCLRPRRRSSLAAVFLSALLGAAPMGLAADSNKPAAKAATAPADPARSKPADPPTAPAAIPQSVFIVPKSRAEGVDPFFPLSTRLAAVDASATNRSAAVEELVVKGFSGSA